MKHKIFLNMEQKKQKILLHIMLVLIIIHASSELERHSEWACIKIGG